MLALHTKISNYLALVFWLGWRFAAPRLDLLGALFQVVCAAGLCLPEVWAVCVHSGAQTKGTAVTWGSFSITATRGQVGNTQSS